MKKIYVEQIQVNENNIEVLEQCEVLAINFKLKTIQFEYPNGEIETDELEHFMEVLFPTPVEALSENIQNMVYWLETQEKAALSDEDLALIDKYLDRKYDANFSTWDNMEFAYDTLPQLRS